MGAGVGYRSLPFPWDATGSHQIRRAPVKTEGVGSAQITSQGFCSGPEG
ncbi:rCG59331 [Rattus norvegicus]|uniref:RCG59331 n=1 Tax=Rattus norvegicus TaxID=10116 RepID=A6K7G8_RAT|nr:rCG59331 [Rattus norvegicus]